MSINEPVSRRVIITGAAIAAAPSVIPVMISRAATDPVFRVIDQHRATVVAMRAAFERGSQAEGGQLSNLDVARARELLATEPTSIAGVVALLRYLNQHVMAGGCWPEPAEERRGADGLRLDVDWTTDLHLRLARALQKVAHIGAPSF
jgi:hypothetical protein